MTKPEKLRLADLKGKQPPAASSVKLRIEGSRSLPIMGEPPPTTCRAPITGRCWWSSCPRRRPCPLDFTNEWKDYEARLDAASR